VVPRLDLTAAGSASVLACSMIINGPNSREQTRTPALPTRIGLASPAKAATIAPSLCEYRDSMYGHVDFKSAFSPIIRNPAINIVGDKEMKALGILRVVLLFSAVCFGLCLSGSVAVAQDVGADIGGGAGIFRAKNPEAKKKSTKATTTTGTKPSNRGTGGTRVSAATAERVEDLLDNGNGFRDARKFTEAEDAYKGVLKIKPKDWRAAYGLGNVYSDQGRWDDAEAAYRNAIQWAPNEVDAYV